MYFIFDDERINVNQLLYIFIHNFTKYLYIYKLSNAIMPRQILV